MPQIDRCVGHRCARSRVEQNDAQGKRYTGSPLHDVGAKKLAWNVVGTGLLVGAEFAYALRLWETVSSGSTLKLECGRYAKAGANKPATGEDRILVVHLSQCRETSLSGENDYMIFSRRLGLSKSSGWRSEACLNWVAYDGARQVFPFVRRSSVFESRGTCAHSLFQAPP